MIAQLLTKPGMNPISGLRTHPPNHVLSIDNGILEKACLLLLSSLTNSLQKLTTNKKSSEDVTSIPNIWNST
jgi:hypothetical protein